jgi:S-adenosylmethionine hydrolase
VTTSYPLITLTSDFGHDEPFVGMMKGVILSRYPAARIVDLTHEIPLFSPAIAGFWIQRSLAYFPTGTVHVAIVDPGVGSARRILGVAVQGQVVLAPDNGLVTPLLEAEESSHIREVSQETLDAVGLPPSATFHGRDLFAPLAAALVSGTLVFEQLGPSTDVVRRLEFLTPKVSETEIAGKVLLTDRFGNLVTNLPGEYLQHWAQCEVSIGERRIPIGRTYSDAPAGGLIAVVNAHNLIEIAANRNRAADLLVRQTAAKILIRPLKA